MSFSLIGELNPGDYWYSSIIFVFFFKPFFSSLVSIPMFCKISEMIYILLLVWVLGTLFNSVSELSLIFQYRYLTMTFSIKVTWVDFPTTTKTLSVGEIQPVFRQWSINKVYLENRSISYAHWKLAPIHALSSNFSFFSVICKRFTYIIMCVYVSD